MKSSSVTGVAALSVALAVLLAVAPACAYDNGAPHSRLPTLGWSSWVALGPGSEHPIFDYCDEASVMAAADAMIETGLYDAGYTSFHLDDCWASYRNASGYVFPEKDHFPNGMKKVVDYAHSKGLSFGLYTCGGTETCVGRRPGSKGYWKEDALQYAAWGVDWVKMDWCNSAPQDPKNTYPIMAAALNATGRPIHFNMCEWGKENPWEWGFDCAQSWRMSGDHTGTWSSTKNQIASSAAIPAEYTGKPWGWNDMDMLETGNGAQAAHANNKEGNMTPDESVTEFSMWAISASPLVVTTPVMNCTPEVPPTPPPTPSGQGCSVRLLKQDSRAPCQANRTYGCTGGANASDAIVWTNEGCRGEFDCDGETVSCNVDGDGKHVCLCGPPKPVKCRPMLNDVQKMILLNKEVVAINQDVTPQGRPVTDGDMTIWARHLSDGSVAVALYNQEDKAQDIGVDFTKLGWTAQTQAKVRDLWAHTDNGTATGSIKPVSVRPHATVVLRLTKA